MFVLGMDPGLTRCGYGLVSRSGDHRVPFRAHSAGVIETSPSDPVDRRLGILGDEFDRLLDEVTPQVVVVERVFFQTNVRTAISVAQASGVILAAAARRNIVVAQFTPNEVKQAVAGHGGATKLQVQEMIARLCGLSEIPKPSDAADALALGVCYLGSERILNAVKRASA
jgi:crossover junction endodeoxyribonuclease RuvC